MKERDVLQQVGQMLDLHGWQWWHVPAPMLAGRDGKWHPARKARGLPDIFALLDDPPRMLILELKGDRGELTGAQRDFLTVARDVAEAAFNASDLERLVGVYVVVPGNLTAIEQIIRTKVLT